MISCLCSEGMSLKDILSSWLVVHDQVLMSNACTWVYWERCGGTEEGEMSIGLGGKMASPWLYCFTLLWNIHTCNNSDIPWKRVICDLLIWQASEQTIAKRITMEINVFMLRFSDWRKLHDMLCGPQLTQYPCSRTIIWVQYSLYDGILNAIPEQRIQRTWFFRVLSSGIWCCAGHWKSTDVLEQHVVSIFKIREQVKQESSRSGQQAELVCCLSFSSTLKMEVTCSFETLGQLYLYLIFNFLWIPIHFFMSTFPIQFKWV
jgi:hypothetical protein